MFSPCLYTFLRVLLLTNDEATSQSAEMPGCVAWDKYFSYFSMRYFQWVPTTYALSGGYTFWGDNSVSCFAPPPPLIPTTTTTTLWKRFYSKRKEFAPSGKKFFTFRIHPFQKRFWVQESKQEVTKLVCLVKRMAENLLNVFDPLN